MMNDDQLTIVLARLDRHEKILNRWDSDFDHVWKNNEDLTIQVGNMRNEITQLRELVRETPKRTSDKVSGAVDEIKQAAQGVKDAMEKKVALIENRTKKHWWQRKGGKNDKFTNT